MGFKMKHNKIFPKALIFLIAGAILGALFPAAYHIIHSYYDIQVHWLIFAASFVLGSIEFILVYRIAKKTESFKLLIRKQNEKIAKYVLFAQKIGIGELDAGLAISQNGDPLSNSLLNMRNNLKDAAQTETENNWVIE